MAVGMAVAGRLDGASWRVYCMLGDGESQAGQIWEAGMLAGKHGLSNLTAILEVKDRATMIVSHTIKGKGVSWMELNADWHGKAPTEEQGQIAIAELSGEIDAEESRRRFEALSKGGS